MDIFDIVVIVTGFGFMIAALFFLYVVVKKEQSKKGKFNVLGSMWYCLAGLNFVAAFYHAIEGKKLIAIVHSSFLIITVIAGFFCKKRSKEIA